MAASWMQRLFRRSFGPMPGLVNVEGEALNCALKAAQQLMKAPITLFVRSLPLCSYWTVKRSSRASAPRPRWSNQHFTVFCGSKVTMWGSVCIMSGFTPALCSALVTLYSWQIHKKVFLRVKCNSSQYRESLDAVIQEQHAVLYVGSLLFMWNFYYW